MIQKHEKTLKSSSGRDFLVDYRFPKEKELRAVVVFAHGFKGFKDWGQFNLVANEISSEGYLFVKFNFSHNGTDPENPLDFVNLNAFSENTFSKEMMDIESCIQFTEELMDQKGIPNLPIYLMGHSRGGYLVTLKAVHDDKFKKVITWAPVADVKSRFLEDPSFDVWKTSGLKTMLNGRTGQQMPMSFNIAQEVLDSPGYFDLRKRLKESRFKLCSIHGLEDTSVLNSESKLLTSWSKYSELHLIPDANHTFNMAHPGGDVLPEATLSAIEKTVNFLKSE